MKTKYVDSFLKLNCASDILSVVSPIHNVAKEITEVYTVFRALRKLIPPSESDQYNLWDLCAGNGLLGVTLAHVFNFNRVGSIDIKVPNRRFSNVRNYQYIKEDIKCFVGKSFRDSDVIVASHPCKNAKVIADLFCRSEAKALVLLPCCIGKLENTPQYLIDRLGKSDAWCYDLYRMIDMYSLVNIENIEVKIYRDDNCISPRNIVITAIREG